MSDHLSGCVQFAGYRCRAVLRFYPNRRLAIVLLDRDDGEPVACATANVPDIYLASDEVIVKDYGENTGMLKALIGAGIVANTGRTAPLGFAEGPVCRLLHVDIPIFS